MDSSIAISALFSGSGAALQAVPEVNSRWHDDALELGPVAPHWEIRSGSLPRNALGKVVKAANIKPE